MKHLSGAIAAEFTKLLTTRLWWVLALILLLYIGALAGGLGLIFGFTSANPGLAGDTSGAPPTDLLAPVLYGLVSTFGYVFPVLLGAMALTGEFRHKTLTPTFLATPKRSIVLGAKLIALFVFGLVFGVIGVIASVGGGAGALAIFGLDTQLGDSDTWALMGRAVIALAIWSAIGVGLGTLIPNQVASIVVILAFTQFVEPTLRAAAMFVDWASSIGKFLPGAASDALVGSASILNLGAATSGADGLDWWQGGLVLLGYAVVFAIAGYFVSWKRDVT